MNHYNKDRDNAALGKFYTDHVSAMTREGLHAKSDIASELAVRDAEIAELRRDAERMRLLDELWVSKLASGEVSEGQASKATLLPRVELRRRATRLERAASEPVAYQYAHPYFGGAKIWREEQRWNGHTSDESRALYPAPPIPKGMFTAEESALSAAIAAAPQPQVGVTDEMCSRVWLSKFPQYQHAGDLQREMAMSWLKAWQSELGPALGMTSGYSSVFGNCARYALPDAIVQLKDFPDDWDGYDAVAPLAAAIDDARKFASIWWSQTRPALSVGPLSNGAVHLWWENDDSLAELEFDGSGIIAAFARSRGAAPKISAEVALSDIGAMRGLIRDFTAAINAFTTQS